MAAVPRPRVPQRAGAGSLHKTPVAVSGDCVVEHSNKPLDWRWLRVAASGEVPAKRYGHASVELATGVVLVFGGTQRENGAVVNFNDLHVVETATGLWRRLEARGTPPDPVSRATFTVIGRTAYLFGGTSHLLPANNYVHALDLDSLEWRNLTPLITGPAPRPRWGHAAVGLAAERKLLVFMGARNNRPRCMADLWSLDVDTLTWTELTPGGTPPCARSAHQVVQPSPDRVLLMGGMPSYELDPSGALMNDVFVLELGSMTWCPVAMRGRSCTPCSGHALRVVSGHVLMFGGYNLHYNLDELYEIALDAGSPTPPSRAINPALFTASTPVSGAATGDTSAAAAPPPPSTTPTTTAHTSTTPTTTPYSTPIARPRGLTGRWIYHSLPAPRPHRRSAFAVANVSSGMIILGGMGTTVCLNDAWVLDVPRAWRPETHHVFSRDFRGAVRALLLLRLRDPQSRDDAPRHPQASWWKLPLEVFMYLLDDFVRTVLPTPNAPLPSVVSTTTTTSSSAAAAPSRSPFGAFTLDRSIVFPADDASNRQ